MSVAINKLNRSLARFNADIARISKTIPGKVTALQKKLVLEALKRIVEKTPVDTGRARGNWQVTIGAPAEGILSNKTPVGTATVERGRRALDGLPDFQIVWISNNLEYIQFLEEGSSRQAPRGMVRLTVLELRAAFRGFKK
jgi:hypothetical protein